MVTTIQLDEKVKARLDKLKIHYRESYNELLIRLLDNCSANVNNADRESLIETLEVLSDPEMMKGIAQGLKDFKEGKFKSFEQIKKEMKLNV
jgi:predicted transcriptional regulator